MSESITDAEQSDATKDPTIEIKLQIEKVELNEKSPQGEIIGTVRPLRNFFRQTASDEKLI